jgi:hypothetical protein
VTRSSSTAFALALASSLLGLSPARADDTDNCLLAHEQGQRQRLAGKLRAAHERFVTCSQSVCPRVLRAECSQWAGEVEPSLPTLVLAARDAEGRETTDVRVQIDDEPAQERLPANAVAVDPGEHVVRFTIPNGRTMSQRVIVREGEKNKSVWVSFAPTTTDRPRAAPRPATNRALPASFFVAGGIGLAGLVAFGALGILGKNEQSRIEDKCNKNCTRDEVMPMYRLYAAADVSLVIGALGLGVATVIGISHASSAPPSPKPTSMR